MRRLLAERRQSTKSRGSRTARIRTRTRSLIAVLAVVVRHLDRLVIRIGAVRFESELGGRFTALAGRRSRLRIVAALLLVKFGTVDACGLLRGIRFWYFPPVHAIHGTSKAGKC